LTEDVDPTLSRIMKKIRATAPYPRHRSLRSKTLIKTVLSSKSEETFKLSLLLRTRGCSWVREEGGCTMCGFVQESAYPRSVSAKFVVQQFERFCEKSSQLRKRFILEIYTCGSFFDDNEISKEARTKILHLAASNPNIERLVFECRPEHIDSRTMRNAKRLLGKKNATIAMGLETSDDFVRKKCLNKGFSFNAFLNSAKIVKEFFGLRVYLLLKPPFLTEKESLEDATRSINDISTLADEIVLMPNSVQKYTLVHYLWLKRMFRSPWLWTIVEVCNSVKNVKNLRIGGLRLYPRPIETAHNCGSCDTEILASISKFPQRGISVFENLDCKCKREWETTLLEESPSLEDRIEYFYKQLDSEKRYVFNSTNVNDLRKQR